MVGVSRIFLFFFWFLFFECNESKQGSTTQYSIDINIYLWPTWWYLDGNELLEERLPEIIARLCLIQLP